MLIENEDWGRFSTLQHFIKRGVKKLKAPVFPKQKILEYVRA